MPTPSPSVSRLGRVRVRAVSSSFAPRRGFALLVTIVLVAFLVLILVGLAGFTRVETRVANNTQATSQARQNALFSLNVAVGELQRLAGSDRRVTAAADLGDGSNGIAAPGDGTRHWTGVWGDSALTTADTPSPRLLGWLVSGNPQAAVGQDTSAVNHGRVTSAAAVPTFRPEQPVGNLSTSSSALSENLTVNGQSAVLLAGPNSVGDTAAELPGYVVAPLVNINASAGSVPGLAASATPVIGKYAWWIGDEGVKARINLVDPFAPRPAAASGAETFFNPTVAQEELRLQAAQRLGAERVTDFGELSSVLANSGGGSEARGRLKRTLALEQLPFFDSAITAAEAARRFHDVTTHSAGVLSDTARGGLRGDLTYLFDAANAVDFRDRLETYLARGSLSAGVPLVDDLNRDGAFTDPWVNGPTWEQLWSFYHMNRPFSVAPTSGPVGVMSAGAAVARAHTAEQHGVGPVIVQARLHWGLTVRAGAAPGLNVVDVLIRPAFVIANPHAVALAAGTYVVSLDVSEGPEIGWWVEGESTYRWNREAADLLNGLRFELDAPILEPGEARVFTLKYNETGWDSTALGYAHAANGTYVLENDWDAGQAHLVIANTFDITDAQLGSGLNLTLGQNPDGTAAGGEFAVTLWTDGGERLQRLERLTFDAASYAGTDSDQTPRVDAVSARNWHGGFNVRRQGPADAPGLNILQSHNWRAPLLTSDDAGGAAPGYVLTHHQRPEWFGGELLLEAGATNPRAYWGKLSQGTTGFRDNLPGDELFEAVFFDLPAVTGPLVSLGQLQHFNAGGHLGGFTHTLGSAPGGAATNAMRGLAAAPAYAIGNARASVYLSRTSVGATAGDRVLRDASWLLNRVLWDRYLFSSVPQSGLFDFATDLLSNPRLQPFRESLASSDVGSYRAAPTSAAENLLNIGAFNVNSTSVEAWRALFSSLNEIPYPGTTTGLTGAFARSVRQTAGHATAGDGVSADAWSGYRNLSPTEINALAVAMVDQVRARGPFVSISDFVNRRLASNETGIQGALDAAIEAAGLNNVSATPYGDRPSETGGIVVDGAHRELAQVAGAPGWLKQADLLQALGSGLTARSDTFIVRTYGEARNPVTNDVEGRAWLEAVVQRRPDYVDDSNAPADRAGDLTAANVDFGRKFEVVSFRWLNPDDI